VAGRLRPSSAASAAQAGAEAAALASDTVASDGALRFFIWEGRIFFFIWEGRTIEIFAGRSAKFFG
jgi:hypothetical protein